MTSSEQSLSETSAVDSLEPQLTQWREHLAARPGVEAADVEELTDHLLGVVDHLQGAGLSADEAFLVAIKRLGQQQEVAREFASVSEARLWRQVVLDEGADGARGWRELVVMLGLAAVSGLSVRWAVGAASGTTGLPALTLSVGLVAVALVLGAWFWWSQRPPSVSSVVAVVGGGALGLLTQGLYPWAESSDTQVLSLMHLPIALGVLLGTAYLGRRWRVTERWADYLRFVGELIVYYALIALGGGLLVGLGAALLSMLEVDPERIIEWVVPLGVGGAVVVAAWLVEAKKSAVANIAPVLTAVFTPLFTLLLLGFLVAMAATGQVGSNRDVLIIVDLVLVVVWGLVLFTVVSRREGAPRLGDWLQLALVIAAIAVDVVVLAAIAGRIGEYGASPNKVAALGENLVLLVNLVWSGWLLVGFLRRRRPFADLERWQSRYLPVVGLWAAIVVLVLPVVFGFR